VARHRDVVVYTLAGWLADSVVGQTSSRQDIENVIGSSLLQYCIAGGGVRREQASERAYSAGEAGRDHRSLCSNILRWQVEVKCCCWWSVCIM